jgi:hypothetical protein
MSNSVYERSVEDKHLLEIGDPKDSQGSNRGIPELRMPTHLRLCCQKSECLVRRSEEAHSHVEAGLICKIIRMVVQIAAGFWFDDVMSAHRVPVFWCPSTSRRRLSSQYFSSASIDSPE